MSLATPRRAFALCGEEECCMVFNELSLYWIRWRDLFDGPRMRDQFIRISTIT
jgi:hypothetical protein